MTNITKPSTTTIAVVLFILTVVSYLLKYLLNVILANNLPPETYGNLSLAFRVLGLVATISLLGTATSSKRFLAKYLQHNETSLVSEYLSWNIRLVMRSYLLCAGLALLSCVLMLHLHFFEIRHIESYHLAVYMLWVAPFSATVMLIGSYLQCSNFPIVSYLIPETLRYLLQIALFFLTFLVLEIALSNMAIVGVLLAAVGAVAISELVFIYAKARYLVQYLSLFRTVRDKGKERKWLQVSARLITNQLFYLVLCSLDLVILETIGNNEAEVGYYGAALTINYILWILPEGPMRLITPKISTSMDSNRGIEDLQQGLNKVLQINIISCLLTAGFIVVFSRHLLAHFGAAYVEAQPVLLIVVCSALLAMLSRGAVSLLAYSELEKTLLHITLVEFCIVLILGLILTHTYGMIGVAIANVIAIFVKAVLAIIAVKRKLAFRPLAII